MKKLVIGLLVVILLAAIAAGILLRNRTPPSVLSDDEIIAAALKAKGCSGVSGLLEITYPPSGAVFPPEFPPPTFEWKDKAVGTDCWVVAFNGENEKPIFSVLIDKQSFKPDAAVWNKIKQSSLDTDANMTVFGLEKSNSLILKSKTSISFRVSRDEVGAPIFYRDVPLPFIYAVKNPDTIQWRLGNVGAADAPPAALRNLPVCGNCHSFSADGAVLGMDVDYANDKGSYAITAVEPKTVLSRDKIITWSDYRREDGEPTFGLLSQMSPDGRYVVSTVKDRSVFVPKDDTFYSQLFFPIKGILAIYDRQTRQFAPLPGADDGEYVQSNPSWSPDGTAIYFTRARAEKLQESEDAKSVLITEHLSKDFISGKRGFRYDIYRVPFNSGRGGTPEAVPGASNNGVSNYFPRVSSDGKWLVICQAKNFMLLQPDSALYIMPAAGGTPRRMNCNTSAMNSWHSWSPNSRWLVFSSKQRGPYTRLFLAHIDENSVDSPAVFLEQFASPDRAANIPEFVNRSPSAAFSIAEQFLDDHNFQRQGEVLVRQGEWEKSVELNTKALEMNEENLSARMNLASAYLMLNKYTEAETQFSVLLDLAEKARRNDIRAKAHINLGQLYFNTKRPEQARRHYESALKLDPANAGAHFSLGEICARTGDLNGAISEFEETLQLEPNNGLAHLWLGQALEHAGRGSDADGYYRSALKFAPMREQECLTIAQYLLPKPALSEGLEAYLSRFLKENPKSAPVNVMLGKLYLERNDVDGAIRRFETAKSLDPSIDWIDAKIAELKSRKQKP